jgi:hypothetical protein
MDFIQQSFDGMEQDEFYMKCIYVSSMLILN